MSERILTVDQVADLVQLSPRTVMRAIAAGHLDASQLAQGRGGWRVYEDAVGRWMDARSNQRPEPRAPADVATPPAPAAGPVVRPRRPRRNDGGKLEVTPEMGRQA